MPHVLIKYAHVFICISAGEGSQHFSAYGYIAYITVLHVDLVKLLSRVSEYGSMGTGLYPVSSTIDSIVPLRSQSSAVIQ